MSEPTRRLSVLMPVYNEARTLRTIIDRVLAAPVDLELELVAVDDCSSDASLSILRELAAGDPRIKVVTQPVNMGKGKALRTAIEHMTGDIAIVQDADLEYDPDDYPRVLGPILDGRADAVYGSRFAASAERRVLFFWHSLGNKLLTGLSNMVNDLNLTDMETCYKAIRGDILKQLRLTSDRFGFEPEITARLAQWGARIYEVPISYDGRTYAEGKNIGWRDGVEALWLIAKFAFVDTRYTDVDDNRTRNALGKAPRYRSWLLGEFDGLIRGKVLEIGAGPGHYTAKLLSSESLTATDSSPVFVEGIRRRFGHLANLSAVLADFDRPDAGSDLDGPYDTVVDFTSLQRSLVPETTMTNLAGILRPGGRLLVHVPADPDLFSSLDRSSGHQRRFTRTELEALISGSGLAVEWVRPFNVLGRRFWGRLGGRDRTAVTVGQARLADLATPVLRKADALLDGPGLGWLAVAVKEGAQGVAPGD